MKTRAVFFLVGTAVLAAIPQAFADDAAAIVKNVCSKCHGPDGNGDSALFPRIGGQQKAYIVRQLKQFRSRARNDAHARAYMWGITKPLSDEQIEELANYLSTRNPPKPILADNPDQVARGKDIYNRGIPDREVPACRECHGAEGEGIGEIPRLASQHRYYIYHQIEDFRGLLRPSPVMHAQSKNLTDEEALAVATFLASK